AQKGYSIVVNYSGNAKAAAETVAQCEALGAEAMAFKANVAVADEVATLMQAATDRFGRIDVLVNNAGITRDNLLMRMNEADFDAVVDTNLKGTFLWMKAVSRMMMKQCYGCIINMSSVVVLRGNPGQMNYVASKAGVIGMTKTMAKELASRGITANAIAPGFIETDMTATLTDAQRADMTTIIPMAHPGKPEDVAAAVAFFADEASGYITGQVLCVDGGMTV
ncbi:3-oxoacyl-ACP reductase family protein, partial [Eubacterium aggregans]|uniref:3-oxoacyl-ACP reductase family protein n=1 Tax=Eubacterium aggregans TaxID=81409 RepID=UPI003F39D2EC